ncbi:MAG: M81 family metallopeptidase [Pseudomonadota bacterium]
MSDSHRPARVALGGVILESNAFAPVATEQEFRSRYYLEGVAILDEAGKAHSVMPMEMRAFVRTMHATGAWQPVPTLLTGCQPAGPVEAGFFGECVDKICRTLRHALPLDAVYLASHGAMTATHDPDPDGELYARVRAAVGDKTLIVSTLDLHANISERMVAQTNLLIGYLTNPHVDMWQRGEEAAFRLRTMLAGAPPKTAFIRLPLTPPSTTLLTSAGPYADLIAYGQRRQQELGGRISNVSVFGGFAFSDTPYNGVAILVSARDELADARRLALEIAQRAWADRARFHRALTPLADAVALALKIGKDEQLPAVIYSDAGDNPGGGGGGNTTWLLKALADAGARRVYIGSCVDAALAAEAHRLGEGAEFEAVFNRHAETEYAKRFSAPARVHKLIDGSVVGRLGIAAGRAMELGPSAALQLGGPEGISVIVISKRHQTADPVFFEAFGLDIAGARVVAVKSRGHFRAGFEPWFAPAQVYEVDTAGLTSPVLSRFDWKGLPRPVYPLDEAARWTAPDWALKDRTGPAPSR